MGANNLVVKSLNKSFNVNKEKRNILNDINLDVKQGEFISIVGHSGCGKSTLLKIIAGLLDYDSGEVTIDKEAISEPDTDRGMVFQEHRLFPWLTVKENVSLGLKDLSKEDKEKLTLEYLELVGLEDFKDAYPHQISGGMAQRAAIARALVNKPKILLLDEPFGALDALTRIQMQQEVLNIWEKEKTTMIMVTHDIDEAIFLGDRVVIMSAKTGQIEEILSVKISRPRSRSSTEFSQLKKKVYSHFFKEVEILPEYNI
ncbi:ABC transporter ATP-binding protein [Gottschalkia acidurici]|nr:ABC transporter ATP-binding protein [Gottschalkia acidurici]